MENTLSFELACMRDVPSVVELVNSAYRGPSSQQGWTTEADLLDGMRTNTDEIRDLIVRDDARILLGYRDNTLVASVLMEQLKGCVQLSMLAVTPKYQAQGIGKRLITQAEAQAQIIWEVTHASMLVITLRTELIAYYERRGYSRTGLIQPFPWGIQKVANLEMELLKKPLSGAV